MPILFDRLQAISLNYTNFKMFKKVLFQSLCSKKEVLVVSIGGAFARHNKKKKKKI